MSKIYLPPRRSPIQIQILLSLFAIAISLPEAVAQAVEEREPVLVQAEFSFYTWKKRKVYTRSDSGNVPKPADSLPNLFYFNGGGWEKVALSSGRITRTYKYRGPLPVSFYSSIPSETNPSKPLFTAQFPMAWQEVLFLLKPGGGGSMGAFPMDRSAANLKSGTVRMYNLGDKPIVYRSREDQATLQPGGHDQFSIEDLDGNYLPVQIASEHEGKLRLAYSQKLSISREQRILLLAYHPDRDSPSWVLRTLVIPET